MWRRGGNGHAVQETERSAKGIEIIILVVVVVKLGNHIVEVKIGERYSQNY